MNLQLQGNFMWNPREEHLRKGQSRGLDECLISQNAGEGKQF